MELLNQIAEIIAKVAAIGAGIAAIWVLVKKSWRAPLEFVRQLRIAMAQVDVINSALGRNGGKSIADEIHRQGVEQLRQGRFLIHTAKCVDSLCDVIEKAIFQTNENGEWMRVNRTFSLTFGYPLEAVLRMGWVAALHPDDSEAFMREWHHAIADKRLFRRPARFVTHDDVWLVVRMTAHPTLGNPEVGVIGWFGTVEILSVQPTAAGLPAGGAK